MSGAPLPKFVSTWDRGYDLSGKSAEVIRFGGGRAAAGWAPDPTTGIL